MRDWTFQDLEPVRKRSLWGTECYTDDSDPLLASIHCGLLRIGEFATRPDQRSKQPAALKIVIRMHPKLVHFQGSARAGLRSRSWGNSHDGASFTVDTLEVLEGSEARAACRKQTRKSRKNKRRHQHRKALVSLKDGQLPIDVEEDDSAGVLGGEPVDCFWWDLQAKVSGSHAHC